jgi:hypothetical protein
VIDLGLVSLIEFFSHSDLPMFELGDLIERHRPAAPIDAPYSASGRLSRRMHME